MQDKTREAIREVMRWTNMDDIEDYKDLARELSISLMGEVEANREVVRFALGHEHMKGPVRKVLDSFCDALYVTERVYRLRLKGVSHNEINEVLKPLQPGKKTSNL